MGKDTKKIVRTITAITEQLRMVDTTPTKPTLDQFCPWLGQFHWCMGDNYIELPGQYTGESRPNPSAHAKIIRFGKEVEIYPSLRKPQKLSIFASDAKTYNFLIKYGEDLRQDQRIQQLLSLMTEKLYNDKKCREHNLMIQTYKVIPLNSYCGMLSWVDHTESIHKFFTDGMGRHVKDSDAVLDKVRREYDRFIHAASKDLGRTVSNQVAYGHAASVYEPDAVSKIE